MWHRERLRGVDRPREGWQKRVEAWLTDDVDGEADERSRLDAFGGE